MPRDEEFPLVAEPITAQPYAVENEAAEVIMPRDEEFPLVAEPITAQPYAVENEAAEVIMPRDEEFPLVAEPTTANAEESLFSPRIVDDAEIHYLRAISPEAQDEEYDPFAEPKITGPQFDEALSHNERAEETNQLQEQIPPMYHEFLDIFRQKEGTETLPPSRDYDMRIDLIPQAKLAVAPLYQLTENEKTVLLETIERETNAGRIRPSNAAYGSPMFFVPKKDGRLRLVVDYRKLNSNTINDAYPLPLIAQITNDLSKAKFFTKLDLVGAYQLLRVAKGHEHLTAFRTQYGMYESLVVRDGLRNAPSVFQHFLNEVFRVLIGRGVIVYIDDILIYADDLAELRRLTLRVFEIVRQSSLYLKASKCEFEKTSLVFLGFVISARGIESNPSFVNTIRSFPVPKCLKDSRAFIGVVGYYRRFVPGFSKIAAPINELTRKDRVFEWGPAQQTAFDELKEKLCSAPVLAHYNPKFETILQTDASHFGWGFVISQINADTGLEHPVAIESGRFSPAQINYSTSEKEFLAIVESFIRYRHMLLQVFTSILTDHLNLTYWMTPRQLNPRQARWMEILSPFRFIIIYRPGKSADMPDALSRRSDYHPGKGATLEQELNYAQALPSFTEISKTAKQFGDDSRSQVMLRALQHSNTIERGYFATDAEIINGLREDPEIEPIVADMLAIVKHLDRQTLYHEPSSLAELRRSGRNPAFTNATWSLHGFLMINNRVYVPQVADIRLKLLQARHDSPQAGHPGIGKTYDLLYRDYVWVGMKRDVESYVSGCTVCQRTKPSHTKAHGHLKTLEVPERAWQHITMDFIEELPSSNGYNSILVVVDRLTKWAIFVPTTTTLTSPGLADIILREVVSQHGLPTSIVSDRGSKFTAHFWRNLTDLMGVKLNLSTAYHPQTDGQTERVNQIVEQYLRIFASYNQDDWSALLPQASLVYNNTTHSATKLSPFYANFGYHPRLLPELLPTTADVPEANRIAASLTELHAFCSANIADAVKSYAKYYNNGRLETPEYQIGDEVMLSLENIKTKRPTKKFEIRQGGPYRITERIGTHAYRLQLPITMRIHSVFHVSSLQGFIRPAFPGQTYNPPGPIEVDDVGGASYEVANVINSRQNKRTGRLEYLVEWLGYEGTDEHTSWEPKHNLATAKQRVAEFHQRYPKKPRQSSPKPRLGATTRVSQ